MCFLLRKSLQGVPGPLPAGARLLAPSEGHVQGPGQQNTLVYPTPSIISILT